MSSVTYNIYNTININSENTDNYAKSKPNSIKNLKNYDL